MESRMHRIGWSARAAAVAVAALAWSQSSLAQIYQRAIGAGNDEAVYDIQETRDCGYVTAGETGLSPAGAPGSLHVMKLGYEGAVTWSKFLPVAGSRNAGNTVQESRSAVGGYIVGGESATVANLGILLVRLDSAGNGIWSRVYAGTPFLDFPAGVAVRELPDLSIAAVGRWQPAAGGQVFGLLMRVDPAGNPIFQRVYTFAGAAVPVSFTDVRSNAAGLLVTGTVSDPASGLERALVMQTDAMGNPLTVMSYFLPNGRLFGDGMDIDTTGAVVLSGRTAVAGAVLANTAVWRIDAAMLPVWSQAILRSVNGFQAVKWTNDPSVIVAGTQPAALGPPPLASLVRFSPAGAPSLSRFFGGPGPTEGHTVIHPLRRLTYSMAGRTRVPPTNGGAGDAYLVVANPAGDTPCLMAPGPLVQPLPINPIPIQLVSTFQQGFQNFALPVNYGVGNLPYCSIGCPADFDGNGVVNPADIAAFVNNWNASLIAGHFGGDFNCDGLVAPADIATFVTAWNTALSSGCP